MSINLYPESWQDELKQHLSGWTEDYPTAHIYALIEGVHNESCYPHLKKFDRLPYQSLYSALPNADEETLGLSPILMKYVEEAQEAWLKVLQKTDGLPALSIIITPETISEISARLYPWCVVQAADYMLALAFSDTRILPELVSVLTPDQHANFFGPAFLWQYVTRTAEWQTLPLPKKALPPATEVKLDEKQYTQLMHFAEADAVLFQLQASLVSPVDCYTPALAHELIRHWLTCADHAHIKVSSERISLCEFGLTYPELERYPQTSAWLATPSQPQTLASIRQKLMGGISQ